MAPPGEGEVEESDAQFGRLAKYGYKPKDASSWESLPGSDGAVSWPTLVLHVGGHEEADGHTWYTLECSLASTSMRPLSWRSKRRLAQLREGLQEPLREALGELYAVHFARAPFALRGGPPGTTARLRCWFE